MNDFDWDVLQKKRIAASARRRVCGSKSRYCGLPSDHLTPAQIKARSGPVMTYAMNQPMSWRDFKAMPLDLQQAYLDGLHNRFGCGASNIGSDLFGMNKASLCNYARKVGLKPIATKGNRMTESDRVRWEEWLNPPAGNEEAPERVQLPELEEHAGEPVVTNHDAAIEPLIPVPVEEPLRGFQLMPKKEADSMALTELAATFTGEFSPEAFVRWAAKLPIPEGPVKIRMEVTCL